MTSSQKFKVSIIKQNRAQLVTFDIVGAAVFFLLALGICLLMIAFLPLSNQKDNNGEFEILYSFDNIEMGLQDPTYAGVDFYKSYRVDKPKLDSFASTYANQNIDSLVLGAVGGSAGIGLDEEGYDTCLYFTDNTGAELLMAGRYNAIGTLRTGSCSNQITTGRLCQGYRHALSTFRPVFLDTGGYDDSGIIQMNVVACKI